MDIDFDKIRKENIIEYGVGVRHLSFLGRLYADKTHFIFELLQNAEDAKAQKIKFSLYPDRLEVLHDGKIFNADPSKDDVRSICGIDESTKTDDLTQIGKFGIGFKSVYAYTQMPEVHCKGIHFKIEHFVRPHKIKGRKIVSGWTTLFVFPFASTEVNDLELFQQISCEQISNRLQKLSVRTLLFLRNLEEIEYDIYDGDTTGIYLRENKSEKEFRRITVIGQQKNKEPYDEQWIVFSSPISETTNNLNAEIAFKLKQDKNGGEVISKLKQSYLNVFFPTEKETHLGFLVQGPYRTTPARDNIPQGDEWNERLVNETAELLKNSLQNLKKEGLLSVSLLETLPINVDDYPYDWMFWPLCNAAKQAFVNNALLPAANEGFVKALNAKLARGKGLRVLVDDSQLTELIKSDTQLKWLSGKITQDRTPDLRYYLINELNIEEIDPENFAKKISPNFLCQQTDNWHIEFYDFLTGQEALWRKGYSYFSEGSLRQKPIIRCKDGENRQPYDANGRPQVFLPVLSTSDFPVVEPNIYENEKAKSFLKNLGLAKPDICAKVIKEILPFFETDNLAEKINLKLYQENLNLIEEALQVDDSPLFAQLIKNLKLSPWVLSENQETDQLQFKEPSEVYMPTEDLCMYFEGNENIWFVANKIQISEELLLRFGVSNKVKITCRGWEQYKKNPSAEIWLCSMRGQHEKGIRCFDYNTTVDGLEKALELITIKKAIYIWNILAIPLSNFIKGEIKEATRKDFSNATTNKYHSKFGAMITKKSWVPSTDGNFKKPFECCVDDLHYGFIREELLIKQLRIIPSQSSVKAQAATEFRNVFTNQGISMDIANFFIENKNSLTPEVLKEALTIYQERRANPKPAFPTRKSPNPERRKEKIRTRHDEADSRTYEKKERSIKTSRPDHDPKIWLKDQYTNGDQELICQMCTNEMPFKLKDGSYHFEAVQVSDDFPKDFHELRLALCPLCAAKYRYLAKNDHVVMDNFIASVKESKENFEIPIELGLNGLHSIRFVEIHLFDLKTILEN